MGHRRPAWTGNMGTMTFPLVCPGFGAVPAGEFSVETYRPKAPIHLREAAVGEVGTIAQSSALIILRLFCTLLSNVE